MEDEKATHLSHILDWPIDPDHMILSHTPMREIATTFASTYGTIYPYYVKTDTDGCGVVCGDRQTSARHGFP